MNKIQSKDIPNEPILTFLKSLEGKEYSSATLFKGFSNSLSQVFPDNSNEKMILAKMKKLVKAGLVDGCTCGCRGDFVLLPKGHELIKK